MSARVSRLVVTPGEPAGIGPDVLLVLAQQALPMELVALADPAMLAARARLLGLPLRCEIIDANAQRALAPPGVLRVIPMPLPCVVTAGVPEPQNSPALLRALDEAVAMCLQGDADAMVTGPLHKAVINQAGLPFSGHTEYLAARTGSKRVVMMLSTTSDAALLRVALATTHLPLRQVPDAIDTSMLLDTMQIIARAMKVWFGLPRARLTVLGLNPHAGEDGVLGDEEQRVIAPALAQARTMGLQVTGPISADSAFVPAKLEACDVVLAMFHDQGLPVLKHMGFGRAVNVTLGLPIIRTSVDHGTALGLAGTGRADAGSMHAACALALEMIHHARETASWVSA
jgi:4-hydroxythreonine-4-phosphate dehydrogenase